MKTDKKKNTYNNLKINNGKVRSGNGASGLNIPNPASNEEREKSYPGLNEKKKIADAMDAFQQRIEMTPGGEQSD